MIKSLLVLMTSFVGLNAFAWKEGTFNCKNVEGLPNTVYEIKNVNVDGVDVPYVIRTRYYKGPLKDGVVTTVKSEIKGFATASSNSAGQDMLIIGQVQIEFENDEVYGCKAP